MSEDIIGKTFGSLTVVARVTYDPRQRRTFFRCECACGTTDKLARLHDLRTGKTRHCGCGRPAWTEEQDEAILRMRFNHTIEEIAARIDRSCEAVRTRLRRLTAQPTQKLATLELAAGHFAVDEKSYRLITGEEECMTTL